MIDLYTWGTPNGWKASVTLEELGIAYTVHPVDIGKNEQKSADYLAINPNGRIPAIVDRGNDDHVVFESGAIMLYLAEKAGKLLPSDPKKRSEVVQWLMFQMGGVGPMQGQANVFLRYFPDKIPAVIERYQNETNRLYGVLDKQLEDKEFLVDNYSIADIANWCWVRAHAWAGLSLDSFSNLSRWNAQIAERSAAQRGVDVPFPRSLEMTEEEKAKFIESAQAMLTK